MNPEVVLGVAIAVLIIVIAFVLSGSVNKSKLLKVKEEQLAKVKQSHYELVQGNQNLESLVNTYKKVVKSFESNLPDSLYVKDSEINSYRVKIAKEGEFEGVKEGKSVAFVRRRVHGEYKNVQVELGVKI